MPVRQITTRHDISHRDFAALWLLALAAASAIGTHGIAYWDAGDYTLLAINGCKSGLLLGRPLFLWASRLVLVTGVEPAAAEPVLRWFWTGVSALAAPLLALLATRLGLERRPSLFAGIALALSPSFAHTSHQVLTDGPALAYRLRRRKRGGESGMAPACFGRRHCHKEMRRVCRVVALRCRRRGWMAIAARCHIIAIVITHQPPGVPSGSLRCRDQSSTTGRSLIC